VGGLSEHRVAVDVREVHSDTVPDLEHAMGDDGDRVGLRLTRGSRCFGAWRGSALAGYGWVSTDPEWIGELSLEMKPAQGEAYLWNCATVAEYRRLGVFGQLLRSMKAHLETEGFTRIWIGSMQGPGETAVPAAGFVPVLRFDSTARWGARWLRILPAYRADPTLVAAARQSLGSRGVPLGSGFYLGRGEKRVH
jgi:GNAT superfamily N-acetyltransferase